MIDSTKLVLAVRTESEVTAIIDAVRKRNDAPIVVSIPLEHGVHVFELVATSMSTSYGRDTRTGGFHLEIGATQAFKVER